MSGTTSNSIINCYVTNCNQVFFNHTVFVQKYRICVYNLDKSSPLYFDKQYFICAARCTNIVDFFQHANVCGTQYAKLKGFMPQNGVPNCFITNNKSNLLVFVDSYVYQNTWKKNTNKWHLIFATFPVTFFLVNVFPTNLWFFYIIFFIIFLIIKIKMLVLAREAEEI